MKDEVGEEKKLTFGWDADKMEKKSKMKMKNMKVVSRNWDVGNMNDYCASKKHHLQKNGWFPRNVSEIPPTKKKKWKWKWKNEKEKEKMKENN